MHLPRYVVSLVIVAIRRALDVIFYVVPGAEALGIAYFRRRHLRFMLRKLVKDGIHINVVYDIGARHAEWSIEARKALGNAEFILFEANDKCAGILAKSGFRFLTGILSSQIKTVSFYDNDTWGDSYYREKTRFYENVKPIDKVTTTLDLLIDSNKLPLPDLIKIDTQGSELDILRGGMTGITNASVLYLEVPILSYNDGAPTFQDYVDFMLEHKFVPYEICEQHYSDGALVQIDIMFINTLVAKTLRSAQVH
jgi:FkbM family methyltransferase